MGHGQIAGTHCKCDVVFRLGEPLEEDHAGFHLGIGGLCHGHTGTLLDRDFLAALKVRRGQDFQLDVVALGVAQHHLRREVGRAGVGADVGQNAADFNIVAAEVAAGGGPALDVGNIVVIPQLAGHVLAQAHGHLAVLDIKDGLAQLFCADEHIVCHRVAAKQGFAVVGRIGLGIRPVVVGFGGLDQTLHRLKVGIPCAGGGSEELPVGIIQEQKLRGLCHREDLDAAAVVEVALGQVAVHIGGALLVSEIGSKVSQLAHLVHGIGGVCIGHKDVGHGRSAHLALCRSYHLRLEVIDAALAVALHGNVLFLADGIVEGIHQLIEALQLVAVVICPDAQIHRLGVTLCSALSAPAAHEAQHQSCSRCKRGQTAHSDSFHHELSPHYEDLFIPKDIFIIPPRGQRCKHVLAKSAISQQLFSDFVDFYVFLFPQKSRAGPRRPKLPAFGKAQVCPASDIQITACSAGDPERYPSRPSPSR